MKILVVGRCDGWMNIHVQHLCDGFRKLNQEVCLLDYRECKSKAFPLLPFVKNEKVQVRRQTEALKRHIQDVKPDMILLLTAHLMFDHSELRRSFSGSIVFYDMDGPAHSCYAQQLDWIREIDFLFTVSRVTQRQLVGQGFDNVHYLPHGVDTDYYRPITLTAAEINRFSSPLSFVGRPTPRRIAHLETLSDDGLVLWGSRWSQGTLRDDQRLFPCVREDENVIGEDLVKVYAASTVFINILREPFVQMPTIMSLQVFAVPATGGCLLTEWVEEIEEAFEPGVELLTFKNADDFRETALYFSRDREAARKIGDAGRKRCLAEHTHAHRAEEILSVLA